MRTIKFRVWSGADMVYDVVVGRFGIFYVNPENGGLDPNDSASLNPLNTKYPDDIPLMQFTGLVDKNGKEIYEGDILSPISTEDYPYLVKFDEGEFCLYSKFGRWGSISKMRPTCDKLNIKINVIGNIYENPEFWQDAS